MTRYFTIGRQLGHSYSKIIHREFGRYDFDLLEFEPEAAREFMLSDRYAGITITIPYKQLALELCDTLSPEAERIGCVNTIVRDGEGRRHGYNTDYGGFLFMAQAAKIDFRDCKVLILGSGGTSRTARTVVRDCGAREIIIVSRKGEVNYHNLLELHSDAQIIINTTPVGMYPDTEVSPLDLTPFHQLSGVLDAIYNPMRTRLTQQARNRGLRYGDGLKMLVAQALFAMEHFLGEKQEEALVGQVCAAVRRQTVNIVLVGMAGCGKTSLGRRVAQVLHREFLDLDEAVASDAGMSIPEIFALEGEAGFRAREKSALSQAGRCSNLVLASGGGAVLSYENRYNLAQNGFVYHLQRAVEHLPLRAGRPLSTNRERVRQMAAEREPLYQQIRDGLIDNNRSLEDALAALLEAFNRDIAR